MYKKFQKNTMFVIFSEIKTFSIFTTFFSCYCFSLYDIFFFLLQTTHFFIARFYPNFYKQCFYFVLNNFWSLIIYTFIIIGNCMFIMNYLLPFIYNIISIFIKFPISIEFIFLFFIFLIICLEININIKHNLLKITYIFFLIINICTLFVKYKFNFYTTFSYSYILFNSFFLDNVKIFLIIISFIVFLIIYENIFTYSSFSFTNISIFSYYVWLNISLFFILCLFNSFNLFFSWVCLEGLSISLIVLSGLLNKNQRNCEATIKYFIISVVSSFFILCSISLFFPLVKSLNYTDLIFFKNNVSFNLILGCIFLFSGLLTKLGLFPFHMYALDVYEGLSIPTVFFFLIVVKPSIFLFLIFLSYYVFYSFSSILSFFFLICGFFSMVIGSFGAILQVKLRRFISYISLNQGGFILISISCLNQSGLVISILFILVYISVNLTFFAVFLYIASLEKSCIINTYSDFLYARAVNSDLLHLIGFIFIVVASIPPFLTFFIKYYIYLTCMNSDWLFITFFILVLSLINSYFYFNLISWFVLRKISLKPINFKDNIRKGFNLYINNFKINRFLITIFILLFLVFGWFFFVIPNLHNYFDLLYDSLIAPFSVGI